MSPTLASRKEAAKAACARLEDTLRERHPSILAEFDLDGYSASYRVERPPRYRFLSDAISETAAAIRERSAEVLFLYNRYMLLSHVAAFDLAQASLNLPVTVVNLYPGELGRIVDQAERLDAEFFDLSNDAFIKDLAIAAHRLIPVGAEFAEPGTGIPRSVLLRGGARQLLEGLKFVALRCRGFWPFLALHTHILSLDEFNPEGWNRAYHRLADLLEWNPQILGWISESWFLDPRLAEISPRLAYLRQVPNENGARFFFTGFDRSGTSGALARSPTRRRLFAEGRYVPATYMRVWPRRALIAWSRRNRGR